MSWARPNPMPDSAVSFKRYVFVPIVLVLVALLATAGTALVPEVPRDSRLPNIILIVMDTVRVSATSLASPSAGTTPFLRSLAERGVVFESAYSTFDVTPESHFSIFTGLKRGFMTPLDRPDQSVVHHLGKLGYDSLGVSANFNVRKAAIRATRPFDLFVSPVNRYLERRMPERFFGEIAPGARMLTRRYGAPLTSFNQNINACGAPSVNAALADLLRRIRPPAVIFANFIDAHDPYFPPPAFHSPEERVPVRFSSDVRKRPLPEWMLEPNREIRDADERRRFLERLETVGNRRWSLSDDLDGTALGIYEKRYLEEIAYLDSQLKETVVLLEARGFLDNSLLIITSDHGESFGELGYLTHGMHNQGDVETTRHVPLLMVPFFAESAAPKRVSDMVSIADIAPTIYSVVGLDDSAFLKTHGRRYGKSLGEYLERGPDRKGRRVELDEVAPIENNADDEAALIDSLKALGYIEDE